MQTTTYLLHYAAPYPRGKHPQHYLGWAVSLRDRLTDHRRGGWAAAALTRAMAAEGISFELVRTWDGGPEQERRLKRRRAPKRLCPVCSTNTAERRSSYT